MVNYLAAAYAAFEVGERDEWKRLLELAEVHSLSPSQRLIPCGRSSLSLRAAGAVSRCARTGKETSLNDPTLMTLLKDVYFKLEEWSALESLLPTLEKNKVIASDEAEKIRKRLLMENLSRLYEKAVNGSDSEQAQLRKQWKKIRSFNRMLKLLGTTRICCSILVIKRGRENHRACTGKCWDADLIRQYGAIDYDSHSRQLLVAEGWLKSRPADAELLLTLARLCMRGRLWGKARGYYEASIKIKPTVYALGELGRMLRQLGEMEASESCLRRYDEMVGGQLLNLPMPEKTGKPVNSELRSRSQGLARLSTRALTSSDMVIVEPTHAPFLPPFCSWHPSPSLIPALQLARQNRGSLWVYCLSSRCPYGVHACGNRQITSSQRRILMSSSTTTTNLVYMN